jgi:hypothetical protein
VKAAIIDLRYRMKDVLRALDRNEKVGILYHGKLKGFITSAASTSGQKAKEHPFFALKSAGKAVEQEMHALRGGRHRDL